VNLPVIIGGIIGYLLGLIILPFYILYLGFRDRHEFGKRKKARENQREHNNQRSFEEPPSPKSNNLHDLYNLLGVRVNASKEELRKAFKVKMMMNHPDKLSTLDPELQKIASERTIAIKDAYERLTAQVH